MSKVQFIRFKEDNILVRFQGMHRNIKKTPEEVGEIYDACKAVNENPSDENISHLKGLLNPITKSEFTKNLDIDKEGNIYLKDTKEKMPSGLTSIIKKYLEDNIPIDSLINFWRLCLDNPNKQARDGFYKYISDFGVVITDHGYAILYKAVNVKGDSDKKVKEVGSDLSRFVSSRYLKIKNMKKSPKNYHVFSIQGADPDGDVFRISTHKGVDPRLSDNEKITKDHGVLQDLYDNINEESQTIEESTEDISIFEPSHTGDHGMEIRIGEPVTMPREKCDPDISNDCSYGLHVGSHKYVSNFGSNMDAILAILVNPRDVVALPQYDHSKIRVCKYFPYAEMERDENGNWEEIEHGFFEEDFLDYEIEELEERLQHLYDNENEEVDSQEEEVIKQRLVYLKDVV